MTKALWINSADRTITEVECNGLADLQRFVGGYIEIACLIGENVLFVDEEGLLKPQSHFFMCEGNGQPLSGNGIVVGPERNDHATDVRISVADLAPRIRWLTRAQVDSWGKANASDVASSIMIIGRDGESVQYVTGRMGGLIGSIPRK